MRHEQKRNDNGKERVRGSKLAVFIKSEDEVPLVEALRRADKENRVIASNKRLEALVGSDIWRRSILRVFDYASGTMTGYKEPGEKFGKYVIYTDPKTEQRYVFPVPEDYKEVKNAILVVEHPDYTLEKDGKDLIVAVQNLENIDLVEGFPSSKEGRYFTDSKHGIPIINGSSDCKYLCRTDSRVGPVARFIVDHWDMSYSESTLHLTSSPSSCFGVIVEAPFFADEILRLRLKAPSLNLRNETLQLR